MLSGNTAPWLFNRTIYANGAGGASSSTQQHADQNGNLIATVISDGSSTPRADSLLVYSPHELIDAKASGNAGTGLRSNANNFGSYYADPETGLLYARARYFDPASGHFISRDPVDGDANLSTTWGACQYWRDNPYGFTDPNGECDGLRDCSVKTAGG